MPSDGCVDIAAIFGYQAMENGMIDTFYAVFFPLCGQANVGGVIFSSHKNTGSIFVDAVDNTGTYHAADA